MGGVMAEAAEAVDAVFDDLEPPKVTLRRYRKGLGGSGSQSRQLVSMAYVEGLITPGTRNRPSRIYLRAEATQSAKIEAGSPEDDWTIQEDDGPEVTITGSFKRFGPGANTTTIWRADLPKPTEVPDVQ